MNDIDKKNVEEKIIYVNLQNDVEYNADNIQATLPN